MSLPSLYTISEDFRQQAEQLADLDIPIEAMNDTLESLQWPVEEKARAIAAFIGNMDAAADLVAEFAKRKGDEAKRMKARADSLRAYLLTNMKVCGISEIKALDGSMTIKIKRNPPSVVITDASKLPFECYVYPAAPDPYPDKKLIAARLKSGDELDGAHLERGERLEIR